MPWVRLDDTFPEHPKIDAAGGDAAWLHVCALAYCSRNLTDGFIANERLARLSDRKSPKKLAERLVEVGLWERSVDNGFVIHDYHDFNPTRDEVLADRAQKHQAKADAGRKGGIASGVARRKHSTKQTGSRTEANGEANGKRNEAPSRPVPSPPLLTVVDILSSSSSSGCFDDDDWVRTAGLVADARVAARPNVSRPTAYRARIIEQLRTEPDGELIRRMLADGDPPEAVALFVLGYGMTTEPERTSPSVPWCPPDCTTCDGDAWIDTGNGLAPCPERKNAS